MYDICYSILDFFDWLTACHFDLCERYSNFMER